MGECSLDRYLIMAVYIDSVEQGERFSKEAVQAYVDKAALKHVVSNEPPAPSIVINGTQLTPTSKPELEDCADVFITIAKNTSMTGQQIQVGKLNFYPRRPWLIKRY